VVIAGPGKVLARAGKVLARAGNGWQQLQTGTDFLIPGE
jgi:hypothetical protein